MITDELKNKNYSLYLDKLRGLGVNTEAIEAQIQNQLINATYACSNENGVAYDGSLLHIVLRTLTPYAIKINSSLPANIQVEQNSIVKVCLLSHLSKCQMFIPNDNEWEKDKRGIMYKYAPYSSALKMGARSIILAQSLGINFTQEEFEAMMIIDKDDTDIQSKFHSSPLALIVKQANELTFLQIRLNKE